VVNEALLLGTALLASVFALAQETLPPLTDGNPPRTLEAMWAGFDPRAESLEVETLKGWEQEGRASSSACCASASGSSRARKP